jgi:hypothetical protein
MDARREQSNHQKNRILRQRFDCDVQKIQG